MPCPFCFHFAAWTSCYLLPHWRCQSGEHQGLMNEGRIGDASFRKCRDEVSLLTVCLWLQTVWRLKVICLNQYWSACFIFFFQFRPPRCSSSRWGGCKVSALHLSGLLPPPHPGFGFQLDGYVHESISAWRSHIHTRSGLLNTCKNNFFFF